MILKGKKALVTGGSRGIGQAIVSQFLREGAEVYFISTRESEFMAEMEEIAGAAGSRVYRRAGDVSDEPGITAVVQGILEESGGLDILVNNAGITRDGLSFRMSGEDWDRVIRTNLSSVFYVTKPVSAAMIRARRGSIINISSISGITGNPGQINYASAKAGIIGYTKTLAKEAASRGVRVNAIAPGLIATEMSGKINEGAKEALKARIPLGRLGLPEEVAAAAVFLASEAAGYITGHVLKVDGGLGI
ncbi:MAG: 3-oxoacyl-[acyl-carrier-protein] reductase [Spirochaetales bacterium]|jgi:3-oxoacyl-[acyl-carrier protein] reductase|nr:3-oxoacyl-[acyl-carrier-protein] reductase [Spirochaetales bacterium]